MSRRSAARIRSIIRNGYALMALSMAVIIGVSRTVGRWMGPTAGWIVCAVLGGGLAIRFALTWHAHRRFAKQVRTAGADADAGRYREALQLADGAIALARKWRFTPDDEVALAFVIRAEALKEAGDKQAALDASARAFSCMCGVERAHTQLTIFDQLGWLLLDSGHARKAIPILEAAVGLGHRAQATPLATAGRLERAAMACLRVGVHANAASAFGKAIDLMTKEKGTDALELSGLYVNLGNCYKRMQKLTDAERCYREALRLHQVNAADASEQFSTILLNLGVICAEQGSAAAKRSAHGKAGRVLLKCAKRWRLHIRRIAI